MEKRAILMDTKLETILLVHWIEGRIKTTLEFRQLHDFLITEKPTSGTPVLIPSLSEEIFSSFLIDSSMSAYKFWEIVTWIQACCTIDEQKELLSYLQSREVLLEL
jgi:hypothetical protein